MGLLGGLDPALLALVALIAYGSAVFHAVGGFAGALVLTIALAPVLGVKEVIPITAVAMILSNSTRLWAFRDWVHWPASLAIFSFALPGIVLGAVIYIKLPVHAVALALGLFLIVTVVLRRTFLRHDIRVGMNGLRAIAVPFGLLSGTVMGAGLMLGPFLLGAGITGRSLVGVIAAVGLGLNLTKSVVFGFSPLLDAATAMKGLLIGLCTIPGAYTGRWIVTNTPIRIHTLFMEALILAGAGYFLWLAAEGLL